MAENTREIALEALLAIERGEDYSHRLVKAVLDKYQYLPERDRGFMKRLMEGTLERELELDYYLDYFSKVPVRKMKPLIRCLLRMGVYQLLYMDAVPDSAACNEACKLAAKRGFGSLRGFVNGILRTISRNKATLPLPEKDAEPVRYLTVKYSMPEWIVTLWLDEYGLDITETLLGGLLAVHPVCLRFRTTLQPERLQACIHGMEERGARLVRSRYLPYVYTLEGGGNVEDLPGFREGLFVVQDVSSVLAVVAAGIKPGDFVMDVCAAPGGKSLLAAEWAGKVLSRDVSEEKAALVRENSRRMGTGNIEVQVYDATRLDPAREGSADVVIVDAPCSGLGVIGKKRDIKYRMTWEKMENLKALQKEIVRTCSRYVKPGGILLYSTCTIHRGENEDMVRFITRELPFVPAGLQEVLSGEILREKEQLLVHSGQEGAGEKQDPEMAGADAACIQILPGYMEGDGFFIARFRKITEDIGH